MGTRSAVSFFVGGWCIVNLHENGIVITGGLVKPTEILFDDIDAVYYDFEKILPGPPQIDLTTFDGRQAVIPRDVEDLDRILAALEREVTRPIVARAKEALTRGEPLKFGPLGVELDGIVLNDRRLSWKELRLVHAERDALVFHSYYRGRFGWVRLSTIPHPRALLAVLRMRTRVVLKGLRLPGEGPDA
jgi:hypothetical protein